MANRPVFNTEDSVFKGDPSLKGIVWKWDNELFPKKKLLIRPEAIPFSYGTENSPIVTVDVLKLGDGYEQVVEAGIRPVQDSYKVVFDKKPRVVARALVRFLEGEGPGSIYERRPSEWFWVKWPDSFERPEAPLRKFRCQKYSITPVTYDAVTVNAEFVESFEP